MMKITTKITLLLMLFAMMACAPKAPQSNLKVSFGAITGSAKFNGGLYVLAKNSATGQEVVKKVPPTDNVELVLDNGTWVFSALGWQGAGNFEGITYCDKSAPINLAGGDFNLNLNATKAKCSTSNQPLDTSGNFPKLSVANCIDIKAYLDGGHFIPAGAQCGGGQLIQGQQKSFKVQLKQFNELGVISPGLESGCQAVTNGITNTEIRLPDGNGYSNIRYEVKTFANADCTGSMLRYQFNQGAKAGTIAPGNSGVVLKYDGRSKFLVNELACVGAQGDNRPFALGSSDNGGNYLICNKAQWDNIAADTGCPSEVGVPAGTMECEPTATYILGANIDFGGTNTSIPTFSGELKGTNKVLSNINQPLFDVINNSAGKSKRLSEFTITGANIVENTSAHIGVLARSIEDSGSQKIEIDRISILNSEITAGVNSTGHIGGMIGNINYTSAEEDLFIRKSVVNVDITTTSDNTQYIGGLVGNVIGSTNASANLAFELNYIGLVEHPEAEWETQGRFSYDDFSNAIEIDLGNNANLLAGGLVGKMRNAEIRFGNSVFSYIKGVSRIGGLIGEIDGTSTKTKISNSFAKFKFEPTIAGASVGGLIGSAYNNGGAISIEIEGSHAEVMIGTEAIPESLAVDALGGIIGSYVYGSTSSSGLRIRDSRSFMSTYVAGSKHGGIVGDHFYSTDPSLCNSDSEFEIERSIVMGTIHDEVANGLSGEATNSYRGGLVGDAACIDARMNVVNLNLEGDMKIGGAFGAAYSSRIVEFDLYANIDVNTGYVGGIAGIMLTATGSGSTIVANHINSLKLVADIDLTLDVVDCGASEGYCGQLYGSTDFTVFDHTKNILTLSTINDGGGDSFHTALCGDSEVNCDGEVNNILTSDVDCTGISTSPPPPIAMADTDGNGSKCELAFFAELSKFARVLNPNQTLSYYRMGSLIDPYELKEVSDWNKIGTDAFLTAKSFKVMNNIDFAGQSLIPIGGPTTPFSGAIFGPGIIKNVDITLSGETSMGMINYLRGGSIGIRDMPLYMDNINLESSTATNLGIVGEVIAGNGFSEMYLIAKDSEIIGGNSAGAAAVGGLVGKASNTLAIETSGFSGKVVNAGGISGGMIGSVASSNVKIEKSFAELDYLESGYNAGGFVGAVFANMDIIHSYVWFDPNQDNYGDDVVAAFGAAGAFAGQVEGSNLGISGSYADFSNAQLPDDIHTITGLESSPAEGTVTISNTGIVGTGLNDLNQAPDFTVSTQGGVSEYFNDNSIDKWATDSFGRVVNEWEIEGFDN